MTPEELLKPRYIMFADYPDSPFSVDEVIDAEENDFLRSYEFSRYPHIFKKLQWHEEQKEEDMPQYIKLVNKKMLEAGDFYPKVSKVIEWKMIDGVWCAHLKDTILRAGYYEPITEEEYNAQQK